MGQDRGNNLVALLPFAPGLMVTADSFYVGKDSLGTAAGLQADLIHTGNRF